VADRKHKALDDSQTSVLRAAFEDAPIEFWIRDADGRCIVQNAAARNRWGDVCGLRVEESPGSPQVLTAWQANNRRAYAGDTVQNEVEYVINGEKRYYQCVVVPIWDDGRVGGILGFNIDLTERKRAEESLAASERKLREALRIGRMGYLDWDLVTNEIRWSPETYRLFGHVPGAFSPTIEATVGMVPPEDLDFVQARLDAVIRGTAPYDIVHRMVRPDGQVIHVHAQGEVMRDEHGKALRMLGTVVDITERRQAEEARRISEERLKQALAAAPAGMWEWDVTTGQSSTANSVVYGSHAPSNLDEWRASLHPDDRASTDAALRDAIEGRTSGYRAEFRVPNAVGGERWVLAVGQVKRAADGTPLRMTGISIDITTRKRAELELQAVDRRKSEFLGVLSHELRNPLAAIRNSLYFLDHTAPGSDQARRALAIIDRQSSHLVRMVDDLLDVTRISSGKIRLQRTSLDLVDVVRRTVDDHRALVASHELVVDLPSRPIWIQGDATRLAQVLGNLLTNAVKFTAETGKISVSLATAEEHAVVTVSDDGLGIDPETLGALFVPFVQADRSLDRTRGGLGLGLALVKSLVELHGGEVGARRDGPGRGACFTIRLPLDAPASAALGSPPRSAARRRLKVLVVEDNRDAAETLAQVVELWGHEVAVASDGVEGLAKARELEPDVVLCDLGLPGELDGYAVARTLRQDARLATTYRVALTGYAQPEDQQRTREAGFEAHIAKPPDLELLERLLAELPARRR
jgi:PAS domain S-box-containing protein